MDDFWIITGLTKDGDDPMRFPTIHLNGTSFETLNREYLAAYFAVDAALDALGEVTVHGRDYYVQEGNAVSEAIEEHRERLRALEKIKSDLVQIILWITTNKTWEHQDKCQ
jgi:hypothetical protein